MIIYYLKHTGESNSSELNILFDLLEVDVTDVLRILFCKFIILLVKRKVT